MLPLHIMERDINSWNAFQILHKISPKFFFFICVEMRLLMQPMIRRPRLYRNYNARNWQEAFDAISLVMGHYQRQLREVLNSPQNSLRTDGHIGALREEWFVSILTRG